MESIRLTLSCKSRPAAGDHAARNTLVCRRYYRVIELAKEEHNLPIADWETLETPFAKDTV